MLVATITSTTSTTSTSSTTSTTYIWHIKKSERDRHNNVKKKMQRTLLVAILAFGTTAHRHGPIPSRRRLLTTATAAVCFAPAMARAVPDATGLFPDCPSATDACVSSQDDRAATWDAPWMSEGSLTDAMDALVRAVERTGGLVAERRERYLRAEFAEQQLLGGTALDDAEFFFTPSDVLVQFRAARRGEARSDFGANRKRLEKLRIALGWEKTPVLRNRRRALVVVESPFDQFGPATNELDALGFTARDMVPAETSKAEMYGDLDPLAAAWSAPSAQMRERRAADTGKQLQQLWLREADDRVRSK